LHFYIFGEELIEEESLPTGQSNLTFKFLTNKQSIKYVFILMPPPCLERVARAHWAIENNLHWVLD